VIVTADKVPQDGSGCKAYKPKDYVYEGKLTGEGHNLVFNEEVLDGALTCIGDKAYWL